MASNLNTRRTTVKGSAFAFISALAFASPAQAETITYTCEGELTVADAGGSTKGNWTVDIDFSASKVKFAKLPFAPAVITDREITFSYQNADGHVEGKIDRLAGTIGVSSSYLYPAHDRPEERAFYQARCQRAATKI